MTAALAFLTILFGALGTGLALDLHGTHRRVRELEAEKHMQARCAADLAHRLRVSELANARLTNELRYLRRTEVFLITQTPPEPRGWSLDELLRDPP